MEKTDSKTELFTQQMRKATTSVHGVSDALVTLKLGVASTNNSVWAEGILVFHEIFGYLEDAIDRRKDSLIGELDVSGMRRKEALEKDLAFYLGEDWRKSYEVRPEVADYLLHLKKIEAENPYLLIAYIYHLYMGLFFGAQISRGKNNLTSSASGGAEAQGYALTSFGTRPVAALKKELREAANRLAEDLDAEMKEAIVKEGVVVFELNNKIIRSVRGVNEIFYRKVIMLVLGLVAVAIFVKLVLM